MNQKTAKLIRKYASETSNNAKDLKSKWVDLTWREKTIQREAMLEEVKEEEKK